MKLPGGDKYVIGYDLSDTYAQISYANIDSENVETISSVAGAEIYTIPAVLAKKPGENKWSYGREALKAAHEEQWILVEHLLKRAVDGESVQIEGEAYDPASLLTLFVKKSFSLLTQLAAPDRTVAIMFTCEKLDNRVKEVLENLVQGMRLKTDRVFWQNHQESFYHYMMYQSGDLMRFQALLCEYRGDGMKVYRLIRNPNTRPVVMYAEEESFPFSAYEPIPEEESLRDAKFAQLDMEFFELIGQVCENQMISSVYLIGEDFSQEWMKDSLRYLCRGRRVFQGNNLYSKGACYGLLSRLKEERKNKQVVFLGNDKIKVNVGMQIDRNGKNSYCALLDAGVNWYEACKTVEFYLQEGNHVEFKLIPLTGEKSKLVTVGLDGLPEGICRLQARLFLKDEKHLVIEIEDLGFGQFRQATHRVWAEELELEFER